MFWIEFTMLLWRECCAEIMLVLEDVYGDLWFYQRENQNMEVFGVMVSLVVSRCAGDIGKTNANTTKKRFWTSVNVPYLKRSLRVVLATYCLLSIRFKTQIKF